MTTETKITGTVEFFNAVKGWGLLKSGDETFFVHHKNIIDKRFFPAGKPNKFRTLKAGQKVEFVPNISQKPMRSAIEVTITNERV